MARKPAPTAEDPTLSPELANLIEGYRQEVVASWVRLLFAMQDSHYREQPVTELQSSASACVSALVTLFRTGIYSEINRYTRDVSHKRAEQGFDIAEIIEGHLLLYEAVLPVIHRETGWYTYDEGALRMGGQPGCGLAVAGGTLQQALRPGSQCPVADSGEDA